jgi:hypothetical protein
MKPAAAPPDAPPEVPPEVRRQIDRSVPAFPGMPWRRRLLFVGLALLMGWTVVSTMVDPPGGFKRNPPPRPDAAACKPGQREGCVGGTATVIVAPAAPAASR